MPEPSRPPPAETEGTIPEQDVHLLQFVYSDQYRHRTWFRPALFRYLSMEYGPSIRNSALRHAILAEITGVEVALPSPLSKEICQYHTFVATRELQGTLQKPENIDVGDMCATYLLAGMHEYGTRESLIHANGCMAICNHLSTKFWTGRSQGSIRAS